MSLDPTQLGALLTDATLREVRRAPTGLTLWLDCPRRSPAGAPLPPVQLNLMGVAAVAVSYDGALVDARPSQVAVPEGARVGDVVPWPLGAEVAIQLNSVHEDEDLALAPQVDWQGGDLAAYRACKVRLRLRAPERAAWPGLAVDAWLGAGAVTARSGGEPLDLARWQREHDAWWLHWAEHWDEDPALPDLLGAGPDLAIAPPARLHPVPLRHGCPDLTYRPPAVPAFSAAGATCPVALLAPLQAWHEGLLGRDWMRMAWAFPHLDQGLRHRAECIRGECLGPGFGRWGYAHGVEDWWVEGARAGVSVRGVEHVLTFDGAEDRAVCWRYALRRRGGVWTIHGFRVEDLEDAVALSACS